MASKKNLKITVKRAPAARTAAPAANRKAARKPAGKAEPKTAQTPSKAAAPRPEAKAATARPPAKAAHAPAPRKAAAPAAPRPRVPAPAARPAQPALKTAPPAAPAAAKTPKVKPLPAKLLAEFRKQLLNLKDRIVDGINFLASENLNHSQREASGDLSNYGIHMADQGTDNFDREFALNMVSNEQDLLYEINEALHRIDAGTYGICEMTGQPIEIERLRAVPYTRYCLAAQADLERGRKRYRSFGPSGLAGALEP